MRLESLRQEEAFSPMVERVLAALWRAEPALPIEIIEPEGVTAVRIEPGGISFDLCFWREGEPRISFFIDDREVLDDSIADRTGAEDCARFVQTVLSHPVEMEIHPGQDIDRAVTARKRFDQLATAENGVDGVHSVRRASAGLSRAARQAGIMPATVEIMTEAQAMMTMSSGFEYEGRSAN